MKPTFIAIVFSLVGAVGCGGSSSTSSDTASSEEALDSTSIGSSESAIMATAAAATTGATSASDAVSKAAANLPNSFGAGCAVITQLGQSVKVVATDCTGPYGLVAVTGTIEITYAYVPAGVTFTATASNLKANRATVDLNASGKVTESAGAYTLAVTAMSSGTGPFGHALSRSGSYTVTWGNSCMALNGTWSTVTSAGTWSTMLSDYSQCAGKCPDADSVVRYSNAAGDTLTVTYDGSAIADYSITPSDRTGTIPLACSTSST